MICCIFAPHIRRPLANITDGRRPLGKLNYVGILSDGLADTIQYDGHPAYDYKYVDTDVYAAAPGWVVTDDDDIIKNSNLAGTGIVANYMRQYHALIIKHVEGFCTIYMHLSEIEPQFVDKIDSYNWLPKSAYISNTESRIGKTGNFCIPCKTKSWHLHFEVWRLDGTKWRYTDPYGDYQQFDKPLWKDNDWSP